MSPGSNGVAIETERLLLRSWRKGDAEEYARRCNTPQVMRWLGGVQSLAEVAEDVEYFAHCEAETGHTFWVLERKADDTLLGFCGIVTVPDSDSTVFGELEIGWRISAPEWRRGYAEEAARSCLDYAFGRISADRVVSRAAKGNLASRGLMEKLGMLRQPALDYRPAGERDLLSVYAINRADWVLRTAP